MKAKLKVLTFKMSSAGYGTDPVPTAAANVLLAQNVDINPLQMETDDYDPVTNTFGAFEKIVGATWCSVSFDVLVGGGGTPLGDAAKVPNHDPLLRCSGMARTLTAGVNTLYTHINSGEEDGTMYYWNDGVLQKMKGIRGSLSWNYTAKKAGVMTFKGMGLNVPMVDDTMPTPTLPTVPRPVAVNAANTTLTIGAYSAKVSQLSIEQGSDVQYLNRTGREEVAIVGRQMSGKLTFEMPLVATKDFLGASGVCTLATPQDIFLSHGTVSGNRVLQYITGAQLLNPKPKEESGILMLECDLHVPKNAMETTYA